MASAKWIGTGAKKPADRFITDQQGDHRQDDGAGEAGEVAELAGAEGEARSSRASPREGIGERRKQQRAGMGAICRPSATSAIEPNSSQVAPNTIVHPLEKPLLGVGKVLIARIDSLEFGAIDCNARLAQQMKLAAQCHKATQTSRMALPLSLRKSAVVFGSPVPIGRSARPARYCAGIRAQGVARRNAIEIAINVYLEQRRRVIAGPSFFQRRDPAKAKPAKIEALTKASTARPDCHRPRSRQARQGKMCLARSIPSTKPDIRRSRLP